MAKFNVDIWVIASFKGIEATTPHDAGQKAFAIVDPELPSLSFMAESTEYRAIKEGGLSDDEFMRAIKEGGVSDKFTHEKKTKD
jgi:hypothetical protein